MAKLIPEIELPGAELMLPQDGNGMSEYSQEQMHRIVRYVRRRMQDRPEDTDAELAGHVWDAMRGISRTWGNRSPNPTTAIAALYLLVAEYDSGAPWTKKRYSGPEPAWSRAMRIGGSQAKKLLKGARQRQSELKK